MFSTGSCHFLVALFIGNAVSVIVLSLIVPWTSRHFGWWLGALGGVLRTALGGAAIVVAIYALCLLVFLETA